ncbi:hypothetical protein [uncultured Nocardioides sp.]|uniref:hypothetical protein n=1 Tax=uncultured Nocardioides sp. TaxID=198441 RepID=UPI002624E07B|nr:hypothetical protein [uncultured Nocardioides sp.]
MGLLRPIVVLTNRAAQRAVGHATAAENADRRYRAAALEAAVQADDAAVLAHLAERRRAYRELIGHLRAALDAADRARELERLARTAGTG